MAKSNDMPEFHSVKVSLTENIPVPIFDPMANPMANIAKLLPAAYASRFTPVRSKGGWYHV